MVPAGAGGAPSVGGGLVIAALSIDATAPWSPDRRERDDRSAVGHEIAHAWRPTAE